MWHVFINWRKLTVYKNVLQYIIKVHGFVIVVFFLSSWISILEYFRFLCITDFYFREKNNLKKKIHNQIHLKRYTNNYIVSIMKYICIFYLLIIFWFVNNGLIKKKKKLDRTKLSIYSINIRKSTVHPFDLSNEKSSSFSLFSWIPFSSSSFIFLFSRRIFITHLLLDKVSSLSSTNFYPYLQRNVVNIFFL